jgi:hypothetical protein
MNQLLYDLPDSSRVLGGMSRSTLFERIKAGEIKTVKVGKRTYIAHDELQRYVRSLQGHEVAS